MENALRTADHLARVAQRRDQLRKLGASWSPEGQSLTLEIGCGHGHFLTAYSAAHPEAFCLGIDLIAERIARATRKKARARMERLNFLQASAEDFLSSLEAEVRLSAIFVLFPDPWPKRRHHKNRIMQPGFFKALSPFVATDSRLYFRTDDRNYFHAATQTVRADSGWALADEPWPFEHETVFQQRAPAYQSFVARPDFFAPAVS